MGDALTLDTAIVLLQNSENASLQTSNMKTEEPAFIQATRKSQYKKEKEAKQGKRQTTDKRRCMFCGGNRHHRTDCPAYGKVCTGCGKSGHFRYVCLAGKRLQNIFAGRVPTTTSQVRIGAIDASELVDVEVEVEVTDNGARQEVKFLPDTGAEIDAIPLSTYTARLADVELQKAVTPKTAIGVPIHTEGKFAARLSWQRRDGSMRSAATEVHVLHNLAQPVLSKRTQIRLGMLDEGYPHTALNRV